ncbi:MAG: 50S ribosomal protein L11 methyltransferase [Deltaproteobacteria bacterium]|nr:50S ribosomal protein L11 methyltransferase [Deltaproteobacteria bacterium]
MRPDDLLYIYEMEGTLFEPEKFFKEAFLAHWREGESTFLFFSEPQEESLKTFLKKNPHLTWVRSHSMSYKDWQGKGSSEYLDVGNLLFIPPGVTPPENREGIYIRLDPGVVFGSGHHPTTRDSLLALLWVYNQGKPETVLDLGTGTGILSLAAISLGAKEILAIDWNPACVETAKKNVALNSLEANIKVQEGRAEEYIQQPAELLVANLHLAVIREVIKNKAFFEKKWVILSGMMRSEYLEVKNDLKVSGFEILKEWDSEFTWFTLAGRNKGYP